VRSCQTKNPCLADRGRAIASTASPPFREGCDVNGVGGRPGSPLQRITVAGQRRTSTLDQRGTGFAFTPSHPGEGHPYRSYSLLFTPFYTSFEDKQGIPPIFAAYAALLQRLM